MPADERGILSLQKPPPLRVDIVAPVYNEVNVILEFHKQLCTVIDALPHDFRVFYINDGSRDGTQAQLEALLQEDPRLTVIELSRNFGHQAALSAGLAQTDADYVITLDSDGQHPPELIPEILAHAARGYDLVLTQRLDELHLPLFKRLTSSLFYNLINRIGSTRILPGGADYRLLSRQAVEALRGMPEYHRFLRGMVAWIGFPSVVLPFTPPERLGGRSKYSFSKMLRLSLDAIFSFSLVPLTIAISIGALFLFLALVEAVYVLSFWVRGDTASLAPGWSSLMFVLLVVGGSLMVTLGIIGIYIGYIFQEVKGRPVYVVRQVHSRSQSERLDSRS